MISVILQQGWSDRREEPASLTGKDKKSYDDERELGDPEANVDRYRRRTGFGGSRNKPTDANARFITASVSSTGFPARFLRMQLSPPPPCAR
jgi:hypothetical protein